MKVLSHKSFIHEVCLILIWPFAMCSVSLQSQTLRYEFISSTFVMKLYAFGNFLFLGGMNGILLVKIIEVYVL